jgi:hypothetical protein
MRIVRRLLSPSVFTLIGLCFVLPFATVTYVSGCGDYTGGTTSFTGIQLVTRTVPPATGVGTHDAHTTSSDVEHRGSLPAEIAFGAAVVGFVLGVLGIAGGPGWCAAVGLAGLLQVFFWLSGGSSGGSGFDWTSHPAFWLAVLLFAGAGVLHLNRWWDRRGVRWSRRLYWVGVVAGVVGLILLVFATLFAYLLGLGVAAVSVGVAGYRYLRRRKARVQLGVVTGASYWEHVVVGAVLTCVTLAAGIWAHALWVVPLLWAVAFLVHRAPKVPSQLAVDGAGPRE